MLEQAIIDATALREAAIKSAEQAVVEKYSTDIKEAVEKLMEQNDFEENKTVDEQIIEVDEKGEGYSFVENTELSDLEQEEMIDIDVKSLFEQVQKEQLEEEIELDEEINEEADMSSSDVDGITGEPPMPPDLDEEIELSKELEESLDFDYSPVPKGQTTAYGATRAQQAEEAMLMDVMLAIEEENSELEKKNESLVKTSNELKKSNQKLKETVQNIADKFKEIKLINSKLFYTNKTLMDASLNERQKGNLVESINNAQTSERAKIVYETLKNTVGNATAKEQPKSLSEAVDKRSSTSLLLKAQKSDDKPKVNESNLFANRMQALAGIKHHKED
tara:strand:+ start:8548 stop:9549 length:1002 start_codon:yes stop_codon:yes gene_type:complete